MPEKRFICLANSRKLGQHCVAGIDSNGNWVRFVNPGGSALSKLDIADKQGKIPRLLETWKVVVRKKEPLYFQPENWVIDSSTYWELSSDEQIYPDLDEYLDKEEFEGFHYKLVVAVIPSEMVDDAQYKIDYL